MEVWTAVYLTLFMLVVVLMIVPVQAEAIIVIGLLNDAVFLAVPTLEKTDNKGEDLAPSAWVPLSSSSTKL